nr:Chain u, protein S21 [Spinacia oleracea]5X8R_u Chain u, protein S21 [Spinacia oleracea]
ISSKKHENAAIAKKEEYPGDLMAVVCPSLAFSNTLYFRSAYNVQVLVDDNENEERLLNRFRREVMRAGVIQECKRRRYFENKQEEKKRKHREAAKRNSRRRRGPFRGPFPGKEEATKVDKKEDDGDNWDMPEGGAPF